MNAELPAVSRAHNNAGLRSISLFTVAQLAGFGEVIDVRSPAEFAEDHVPCAINCPVLDNDERTQIGTLYKQAPFDAKKLGAALVARNIARHLCDVFQDRPKNWRPLIYCWRGGARSGAMTHIFRQIGWDAYQLQGGYKAYRRLVRSDLETLPAKFEFRVLCGPTGSGKSRLLRALAEQGAQVLDLEALAAHRGSVLGNLPDCAQPSQKRFESGIWWQMSRMRPEVPVFVEAESRKVGTLRVPETLIERMWASACLQLESAQPVRVQLLLEDYRHFIESPELLFAQLDCLRRLYGADVIDGWKALARAGHWQPLVSELLSSHYDPAYSRSTLRNYQRLADARIVTCSDASADGMRALARQIREETP